MCGMRKLHPIKATLAERFWKRVRKTSGCWEWTGFLNHGYGQIRLGRAVEGQTSSSRASWIIHFGMIPNDKQVLHHCDNRKCVRPDHLYLGTHLDNMQDKSKRGRHHMQGHGERVAAEKNANAKLSWEQVRRIRKLKTEGVSGPTLAAMFKVCHPNIYDIVHNRTWVE
jgi:hypothetical protein